jgi:hypothetical protein
VTVGGKHERHRRSAAPVYRSICISESYDRTEAVELYDKCVGMYNDADDLKGYQKATNYFLNNCHEAGLIYGDR